MAFRKICEAGLGLTARMIPYLIAKYVIAKYVIAKYVIAKYVIAKYVIAKYLIFPRKTILVIKLTYHPTMIILLIVQMKTHLTKMRQQLPQIKKLH